MCTILAPFIFTYWKLTVSLEGGKGHIQKKSAIIKNYQELIKILILISLKNSF